MEGKETCKGSGGALQPLLLHVVQASGIFSRLLRSNHIIEVRHGTVIHNLLSA